MPDQGSSCYLGAPRTDSLDPGDAMKNNLKIALGLAALAVALVVLMRFFPLASR